MPPHLLRYEGRDALAILFANYIQPDSIHYPGRLRLVPTAANRHLAAATYVRSGGEAATDSSASTRSRSRMGSCAGSRPSAASRSDRSVSFEACKRGTTSTETDEFVADPSRIG
jgi:hypothetical protein